jgi:RNA polymerase sigma factor (sigma-70 family)
MRDQIDQVLGTLEARERAVLRMRYGLDDGTPRTLDEIGRAFGLSRERIRQIERETMAKLRHPSRSESLRDFVEA